MKSLIILSVLLFSINSFGQSDSAMLFNGTSDYLEFSTASSTPNISTEFSIESWVKFDSVNVLQPIAQYGTCFGSNHTFSLQLSDENKIGLAVNDDNSCTNTLGANTNDTIDPTDGCYHIIATFKAPNEVHLYVNGVEMPNTQNGYSVSSVSSSSEKFRVGSYKGGNGQFAGYLKGEMNHFGLFNKELTATEVTDHYANGISSTTANLEIYYPLNSQLSSGTTTVVNEADPTRFNATIVGSPSVNLTNCSNTASDYKPSIRTISVYPNPAFDKVKINTSEAVETVVLYDVNGLIVFQSKIQNNEINGLSALSSGLYIGYFKDVNGSVFQSKIHLAR